MAIDRAEQKITFAIKSSVVYQGTYDFANETLILFFHTGAQYKYYEFKGETYLEFIKARSQGRFLNRDIIGKYNFEKLTKINGIYRIHQIKIGSRKGHKETTQFENVEMRKCGNVKIKFNHKGH